MGGGNELYDDILKSHAVTGRLIARFNLKQHYGAMDLEGAEKALASRTVLTATTEGLIQITVQDEDPKLAADVANAYAEELDYENHQLANSQVSQQRRYFEQEMIKEKNALADAEVVLKQSEEKTGVIEPGLQVQAGLGAIENTRAQLRLRQVELGALEQSETSENPDIIRVRGEIASIESQLRALQSEGGPEAGTPTAKNPERVLAYVRNLREVKFHEAVFDLLSREYVTAKEQESKDISSVEVLDRAVPAEHKTWPPRTVYCLAACFFGVFFGIAYTVVEKIFQTIARNPANRARLQRSSPN